MGKDGFKYEVVIVYTNGDIDRKKARTKKGARVIANMAVLVPGYQSARIRKL